MPISPDSEFIKLIGRQLGTPLLKNEIDALCLLGKEGEELRYAVRGYFKHLKVRTGTSTRDPSYEVRLTTKYVVLTNRRIIAFDDNSIELFDTQDIQFASIIADSTIRATQIFCSTHSDEDYLLLGMGDAAAVKFSNLMNIYRGEDDEEMEIVRVSMGVHNLRSFYLDLRDSQTFSPAQLDEMLDPPAHWGTGTRRKKRGE